MDWLTPLKLAIPGCLSCRDYVEYWAGRLTFAGSTRMLCAKRVTDDAPDDDNVWLLGERPPVLK
jgi:hypothetical protein